MASSNSNPADFPVIVDPEKFDLASGSWLERAVFNHRAPILVIIAVISVLLGLQAIKLPTNSSFEQMIPQSHPWVQNYLQNKGSLQGQGNTVRIVVENTKGDIYDPAYLEVLRKINDEVFLIPGVDRSWMRSLWMPIVRWTEVTEEGFRGGPVMPDNFDGSDQKMGQLQRNISTAGLVGSIVSNDIKSSMLQVPLLDRVPATGQPIDYTVMGKTLQAVIDRYETPDIKIHITGFAKLVGDLIAGLFEVMMYFGISTLIATLFVYLYTRCLRSTVLLVLVSVLGVVWMLGLMQIFGFVLDPYSILGPFLIFAIGLSHGAQKMNGIMRDVGHGCHRYVAARYTFRRLFLTGLTALLVNVVGFAVLIIIDIPVIRDLALTTSLGVTVLIFTKLVLIPIVLSYIGVSPKAARRSLVVPTDANEEGSSVLGGALVRFTTRKWAVGAIAAAGVLGAIALAIRTDIQIGDLDAGAPELRPDSRYNQDVSYLNSHFGLSSDQFTVIVKTPPGQCETFETMTEVLRLSETLRAVPGVLMVRSAADAVKRTAVGYYEGNPRWMSLSRTPSTLTGARSQVMVDQPELTNTECAILPVIAYLGDHKAATLTRVATAVQLFAAQNSTPDREFLLAAGSAGIEAATNIVVHTSFWRIHFVLYGAVTLLCLFTFRSWRAMLVALIPLVLTSVLCEALMVLLGIGIKVATLPVIALGVGVGVDYALYLLSVQLVLQRQGYSLSFAYKRSLEFTGKVVALIGVTMAAGVLPWAWSPIKFQADMGILLTFMFIWNMLGALILIPALSYFLLGGNRPATGTRHQRQQEFKADKRWETLPTSGR
ncbi:MAG TPA: MMPL family transporter [Pseudomonas sp.]|nr:MMPL family transporter [Pseudomonas sp.]